MIEWWEVFLISLVGFVAYIFSVKIVLWASDFELKKSLRKKKCITEKYLEWCSGRPGEPIVLNVPEKKKEDPPIEKYKKILKMFYRYPPFLEVAYKNRKYLLDQELGELFLPVIWVLDEQGEKICKIDYGEFSMGNVEVNFLLDNLEEILKLFEAELESFKRICKVTEDSVTNAVKRMKRYEI